MLVKDLIKMLEDQQAKYDQCFDQKAQDEIIGPLEIHFDVFMINPNKPAGESIEYKGVSPNCKFTYSSDGVYRF